MAPARRRDTLTTDTRLPRRTVSRRTPSAPLRDTLTVLTHLTVRAFARLTSIPTWVLKLDIPPDLGVSVARDVSHREFDVVDTLAIRLEPRRVPPVVEDDPTRT